MAAIVMAAAVTILAQGFTTGGAASTTASNRTRAAWLAQAKLAEVEAGLLPMNVGQSGEVPDRTGWRWAIASQTSTTTGVVQVTVTITWTERAEERTYSLVRLMRERA